MGCICLLLGTNLLLDLVDLGIELGGRVVGYYTGREIRSDRVHFYGLQDNENIGQATHTLAVILPESNNLVDGLDGSKALALAFPDLLGVAAALSNYSEQHNNRLAC